MVDGERLHQALGCPTPAEVYGVAVAPAVAGRAPSVPPTAQEAVYPSKKNLIFV